MTGPQQKDVPFVEAATKRDLSLSHLQAELARIDVLLRREIRRWQMAGQDQNDAFRGLYISDDEANALLDRPFAASWGNTVTLDPDEDRTFSEALLHAAQQAQSLAETAEQQGHPPRLSHLAHVFGLDRFDLDTLLICLAPTLDLRYERFYGYLQDDVTQKRPTVNLVLNLLCAPGSERLTLLSRFSGEAPLFRYRLVEHLAAPAETAPPLLRQTLRVDDAVVSWLLGTYRPHADLGTHATLSVPRTDEAKWMLPAETRTLLERALVEMPVIAFYGSDRAAQRAAAHFTATCRGRALLAVDLDAVIGAGVSPAQAVRLALRDARLNGATPFLSGWDACLIDGSPPPELLAEVLAYPEVTIIGGRVPWQPADMERDRNLLWLEFPTPSYAQRQALWCHYLGTGASEDVSALAGQFLLTAGQIRDAVASAQDAAAQRGSPLQSADLFAAARAYSNPRLSRLAHKIIPRYDWHDIVLPDDQRTLLHEIVATVRGRPQVLEQWGVGRKLASSKGVTILFAGPPGTGKTMSAEIIAHELNQDLYKIDLSTIVSKYIGETEKNLERIFIEAQASNAILFFDEADALFGKRSEVRDSHDRYANIEISYLLQRMEAYDGVTILATNLRANLDEAFTRRLQFAVDFPFPEEADRLRIWQTLFPPDVPRDAELDFGLLARRFKLAGGNIRNILVSAAYLAAADGGQVTMDHLLHGTRRELQKMGRLVGEGDF
ncbi:MAG: ATP-binding protein [Chloroflexi bacterium]|nr:ATP-binding protein [Chloroflexota bacterium]